MATMTPAPPAASGARRVDHPLAVAARHRRRIRLAVACYAGMVLLVALAVVLARVLPAVLGVPLFVVLAGVVVVVAHPALRVTLRR